MDRRDHQSRNRNRESKIFENVREWLNLCLSLRAQVKRRKQDGQNKIELTEPEEVLIHRGEKDWLELNLLVPRPLVTGNLIDLDFTNLDLGKLVKECAEKVYESVEKNHRGQVDPRVSANN